MFRKPLRPMILLALLAGSPPVRCEEPSRERLLDVARQVMAKTGYCTLITLDEHGAPQARPMDPFSPEDDLTVWMATNAGTRKVAQLRRDPRATLVYFDPEGASYVTLVGKAELVAREEAKAARWKESWAEFYDDANRGEDYLLIRFTPRRLEVMSIEHDVAAEPKGWKPAIVELDRARE